MSASPAGAPVTHLVRSSHVILHVLVVCYPVCAAASSSALPVRQIEELTSAISALRADQAALRAGLEEKLGTVEAKLAAEQEETRNAVRELQARQGQTADAFSIAAARRSSRFAASHLCCAVGLAVLRCAACRVRSRQCPRSRPRPRPHPRLPARKSGLAFGSATLRLTCSRRDRGCLRDGRLLSAVLLLRLK